MSNVPDLDNAIGIARGDPTPVRAVGETLGFMGMPPQGGDFLARGSLPHPDGPPVFHGRKMSAIGAEHHAYIPRVIEPQRFTVILEVPDHHRLIAAGRQTIAIGTHAHRTNP